MTCRRCGLELHRAFGKLLHSRPGALLAEQPFCEGTNDLAVIDTHEPSDFDWPRAGLTLALA